MDPFTLFALANGAVQAVKKGCQLYKDIKSAAGDVKGVLKDLDDQFHKLHPNPTSEQVKQLNQQKQRGKQNYLAKEFPRTPPLQDGWGIAMKRWFDLLKRQFQRDLPS